MEQTVNRTSEANEEEEDDHEDGTVTSRVQKFTIQMT